MIDRRAAILPRDRLRRAQLYEAFHLCGADQ
jgi:hypothetical protein